MNNNYWFEKYGLNATYSIIEAEDRDLKNIIKVGFKEIEREIGD